MREVVVNARVAQLLRTKEDSFETEDGGIITPIIRDKTISFTQFIKKLSSLSGGLGRDILPNNCRIVEKDLTGAITLVLEDEPQVRTVSFDLDMATVIEELRETGKLEKYGLENFLDEYEAPYYLNLSFPYIVYFLKLDPDFSYQGMRVFFRLHPLTSGSDYLYLANLPNIPNGQGICLGGRRGDERNLNLSISEAVHGIMDRFWSNSFNSDYIHNVQAYTDVKFVSSFLEWSYFTSVDPMFIFNVKWVPFENCVDEELSQMVSHNNSVEFENVIDLFTASKKVRTEDNNEITDNLCDSAIIENTTFTIGDEIMYSGRIHYITSFRGYAGNIPDYIVIEDDDGVETAVEVCQENQNLLIDWKLQLEETEVKYQSIEIKGVEVKIGDIIQIHYPRQSYKKVSSIRRGRDDIMEVKLGKHFYLLENIPFKVTGNGDITVQNQKLTPGKRYYMLSSKETEFAGGKFNPVLFKGLDENESGTLTIVFERPNLTGRDLVYPLDSFEYELLDENKCSEVSTLRLNCRIFSKTKNNILRIFPGSGCFAGYLGSDRYATPWISDSQQVKLDILRGEEGEDLWDITEHALEPDGNGEVKIEKEYSLKGPIKSIFIPSFDLDITFSVGDEVIVADWKNVDNMTRIWKIRDFSLSLTADDSLIVLLEDSSGNLMRFPYINFTTGKILHGFMRKVSRSFNGIPVGTLIKANRTKIQNFPMKDIVEIVAFITDTGRDIPLILCSNLCTIWGSIDSLERFNAFAINSPAWKKFKSKVLPPDPSKIKTQSGDFVIDNEDQFINSVSPMLVRRGRYAKKYVIQGMYNGYAWRYDISLSKDPIKEGYYRYGIISPRESQTQHFGRPTYKVWPNFHNWYTVEKSIESRQFKIFISDGEFERYQRSLAIEDEFDDDDELSDLEEDEIDDVAEIEDAQAAMDQEVVTQQRIDEIEAESGDVELPNGDVYEEVVVDTSEFHEPLEEVPGPDPNPGTTFSSDDEQGPA